MPTFISADGTQQEATLSLDLYKMAVDEGITVPQLINKLYPTTPNSPVSTFEQMCASSGLFTKPNMEFGLKSPTLKNIFDGQVVLNAGAIVREANPAARILFPAVVLAQIDSTLGTDTATNPSVFDQMVALTTSVTSDRTEQPVINYSGPESSRSRVISQLAPPQSMLQITTSQVSRNLPTFSLGLEVSDQALQATTLDLVTLAVRRQVEAERNARVNEYLIAFLNGDADMTPSSGMLTSAQGAVRAVTLDTAIVCDAALTQKAWVKYLYTNHAKRKLDWIVCDIDTALVIESRTNKPTVNTDDPNSPRFDALIGTPRNATINKNVNMYVVDSGWNANYIMGFDSRYAIHRIRNSAAVYSSVEQFVLRRSSAIRFDFSEIAYRMFDDAYSVMVLKQTI